MKLLFVASEAVPFCKTGGLADAAAGLARRLGGLGHEVLLVLPGYRAARAAAAGAGAPRPLGVPFAGGTVSAGLRVLRGGVTAAFVEHPPFFDRAGLYGEAGRDYEDNGDRFAFFARAALEAAKAEGFRPDVVHAHDWQAGLACAHLKRTFARDPHFAAAGCVFTVHNLAYQGNFPRAALERAGFGPEEWAEEGLEFHGRVSYLKAGLAYADRLTTVSPAYAREIQESGARGFGFEELLRRRSAVLSGVLNGLDTQAWDPSRDAALPRRYGPADAAAGKAACKEALRRECGLAALSDRPLLGVVSRLDPQKGLDLVLSAVEPRLDRVQLVALGSGDPALARAFAALAGCRPDAAAFRGAFDEGFSRRVYAACDLFLMPSRFEPCGLSQLIAMRYGAVPVAARTGGLADTVFEEDAPGRPANGFLCPPDDAAGLAAALDRALAAWPGPAWRARARAGMAGDYSWDRAAADYLAIYRAASRAGREEARA
ncbi:MAG: glycogen synthase [Elusimicrobia bacterium]|nr:glycogen synthase [Elusimicrobiota bacterium]